MTTLEQLDKLIGQYERDAKEYSDHLEQDYDSRDRDYYEGLLDQTNIVIDDLEKIKTTPKKTDLESKGWS